MADQAEELFDTPFTCEETTEYDNRIEDSFDSESEIEEEQEDVSYRKSWEEAEQKFARFERNYRIRRIRELTTTPFKRRRGRPAKKVAA